MSKSSSAKKDSANDFAAFVCDTNVTEALVPILAERGWSLESVSMGGIENAIRVLGASPSPQFLLVDISDSSDPKGDINALAEVCEPGTSVIAIGLLNDVGFYRSLIDIGVLDYFVKPVRTDDIRTAIENAERLMTAGTNGPAPVEGDGHKAVAVIGGRGGIGASLLASTFAWISAHQLNKPTALLDLDLHFGTTALGFDLEPGRGLVDALDNPSRVDSLFIERAVIKESENLAVLSAEAPLNDSNQSDPAALAHLLEELRHKYQVLVVDLPRYTLAQFPFALNEMSETIIVSDFTLAGTRDTIRLLNFIREHAANTHVRVVVSKLGQHGPVEVEQRDFEASIERKVDWIMPFDPKSVVGAARQAKPLAQIAPSSKVVNVVRDITTSIIGDASEAQNKSFWSRLVKKA
jgi:pilus assembly protein CpaE